MLKDIMTLAEVAKEYNIPITTLQSRLDNKNIGLIENEDFKRLGERQPTILTPEGVRKITKNKDSEK